MFHAQMPADAVEQFGRGSDGGGGGRHVGDRVKRFGPWRSRALNEKVSWTQKFAIVMAGSLRGRGTRRSHTGVQAVRPDSELFFSMADHFALQ